MVTIYGGGFSPSPSQNAVSFNGTAAASVQSATATQLVVPVPAGATTGPVAVSTSLGSATSREAFTVAADDGTPAITSFTPTVGLAGTAVTLNGTNFDAALASNRIALDSKAAQTMSATTVALGTIVPAGTLGGHFSVTTPSPKKAVSAAMFFVPPYPYSPADVELTDVMTIGGSRNVTITSPGRIGLFLFDGHVGQQVSVWATNNTFGCYSYSSVRVTLLTPDGSTMAAGDICPFPNFLDQVRLPVTGSYMLMVNPPGATTGSVTVTLYDATDITVNDRAGTVSIGTPGQNARFTFLGAAGQVISAYATTPWGSCPDSPHFLLKVLAPDGSTMRSTGDGCSGGTAFTDQVALPFAGSYTILIDPLGTLTGTVSVSSWDVVDVTGSITANGPSVPVTISAPAANARLTFSGSAGQVVTASTGTPWDGCIDSPHFYLSILAPDGSNIRLTGDGCSGGFASTGHVTLPSSGTYTLLLDPIGTRTGTATVTLTSP